MVSADADFKDKVMFTFNRKIQKVSQKAAKVAGNLNQVSHGY